MEVTSTAGVAVASSLDGLHGATRMEEDFEGGHVVRVETSGICYVTGRETEKAYFSSAKT